MDSNEELLFDIETNGFLEVFTEIHCMSVFNMVTQELIEYTPENIQEGVQRVLKAKKLIGHNIIRFDIPAIEKYSGEKCQATEIVDTLVLSRLLFPDMKDRDNGARTKTFAGAYKSYYHLIDKYETKRVDYKHYGKWAKREETSVEKTRRIYASEKTDPEATMAGFVQYLNKNLFNGAMIGRHSLEAWGHRLGDYKGDYGKDMEDPWAVFTPEMMEYCTQDLRVNYKLLKHLLSYKPTDISVELEHETAQVIWEQEQYGWLFDKEAAIELYDRIREERDELQEELQSLHEGWEKELKSPEYYRLEVIDGKWIEFIDRPTKAAVVQAGWERMKEIGNPKTKAAITAAVIKGPNRIKKIPFNPTSREHLATLFKERYNWKPTEFNPKDGKPKMDGDVLRAMEYPEAPKLLRLDTLQDRCEKLKEGKKGGYITYADENNRLHGGVITNGAVTGRATHMEPQIGQVPASSADFGSDFRKLFIVPEDYVLVGSDADGLELRCLAHYMAPYDNGEYAELVNDGDVHTANQQAAELPTRDNAKTFIYGFLYGAGAAKVGKIVGGDSKRGKELIDNFLAKTPALAILRETVKAQVNKNGYLTGLDGRRLSIRNDYAALNTLLQSAGAFICKKWLVEVNKKIKEEGLDARQVGWIHDEIQIEAHKDCADRVAEICVETMPEVEKFFKFKCPLKASADIGTTWEETH